MERLTTKQASEILGVSRRRVIALIEQGKLKADKFASVYTIAQKDLETVRNRKNGRPSKNETGSKSNETKSFAEAAAKYIGSIKDGLPTDLSTNKKHLEGLGRD
jgi:excisionase family DNA binding protein